MAPSATLYISVGEYLKFEVSHNYTPGRNSCHWSLLQYNGPADPMPMRLYGGTEAGEAICTHLLNEMKHYVPPAAAQCNQIINIRLQNVVDLCYEGTMVLPCTNEGTIFNVFAIQDRFKGIFNLFSYMTRESPF